MTLKTTNIVEDNNKAVFLFTSNKKLETQQLLNIKTLNNSTNESEISLATIHHETKGNFTISFQNDVFDDTVEKKITLNGNGNWGVRPGENRITDTDNLFIQSEGPFKIVVEVQKEKGFTNG